MKIKTMEEREREIEKGKQASDTEKHYFYNFFFISNLLGEGKHSGSALFEETCCLNDTKRKKR